MNLITHQLFSIFKKYKNYIKAEMLELGVDIPPQYSKFIKIIGLLGTCKASTLSEKINCDKAHTARALKALEAQNLILKVKDNTDLRANYISLSDQGHELWEHLKGIDLQFEKDLLKKLKAQELAQLRNILDQIT